MVSGAPDRRLAAIALEDRRRLRDELDAMRDDQVVVEPPELDEKIRIVGLRRELLLQVLLLRFDELRVALIGFELELPREHLFVAVGQPEEILGRGFR